MKPVRHFHLIAVSLALCLLLLNTRCTQHIAGGASETGNSAVAGVVFSSDGQRAQATSVRILTASYSPITDVTVIDSLIDTTDNDGRYYFPCIAAGTYSIEAVNTITHDKFLKQNITISGSDTLVDIGADTLKPTGTIIVTLSANMLSAGGHIYIPGTSIYTTITDADSTAGRVMLDSVPATIYTSIRYTSSDLLQNNQLVTTSVTVSSASSDTITAWPHSAQVRINTTPSGANIAGTICSVPVLIRLTSNNFNFNEALSGGQDIGFTNATGKILPFEIERWDAASGFAEIWVGLDTIFGNNSSQTIIMFWGNRQSSTSNGNSVFGINQSWAGVWHLSESAPDTTTDSLYRNSAENANYGSDRVMSADKEGIIGLGQSFLNGDRIQINNASTRLKPQTITLSAWVRVLKIDSLSSDIASMGDNYMLRINRTGGKPKFVLYGLTDTTQIDCEDPSLNIADSLWHSVVGTYDGNAVKLFVDGDLRKSINYSGTIRYNQGPNFVIGKHGNNKKYFNFTGTIDEVECSSTARTKDWIKFSFENQRLNSSVVSFTIEY